MKSVHPLPLARLFEEPGIARRALSVCATGPIAQARAEVEWLDDLLAILEASAAAPATAPDSEEGAPC